jgi:hypothetical protein
LLLVRLLLREFTFISRGRVSSRFGSSLPKAPRWQTQSCDYSPRQPAEGRLSPHHSPQYGTPLFHVDFHFPRRFGLPFRRATPLISLHKLDQKPAPFVPTLPKTNGSAFTVAGGGVGKRPGKRPGKIPGDEPFEESFGDLFGEPRRPRDALDRETAGNPHPGHGQTPRFAWRRDERGN